MFKQHATYSQRGDAVYVYLHEGKVARTKGFGDCRNVDYDADGNVVGVEFIGVSQGIDLDQMPERSTLERLIEPYGLKIFA